MSDIKPKAIELDRSFFKKERDIYDNYKLAIFRENLQNSIDAGARNIAISIVNTSGEGVFGRPTDAASVTRLVFDDDGHGMTRDVVDNVYFRPGQTTKGSENGIGGFGRGRIVSTFANQRYTLLTNDTWVEGQGGHFISESFSEAIERKRRTIRELSGRSDQEALEIVNTCLCEISEIEKVRDTPGWHGVKLLTDIDRADYAESWKNTSAEEMQSILERYLELADIPANITINGTPVAKRLRVEPKVRDFTTSDPDEPGRAITIGTVHRPKSQPNDKQRDVAVVRIKGTPMYERWLPAGSGTVVIELDVANHRKFLTSNRDGFNNRYSRVIEDFISELSTDNVTAMKERRGDMDMMIAGELGDLEAKLTVHDLDFAQLDAEQIQEAAVYAQQYVTSSDRPEGFTPYIVRNGFGLVNPSMIEELFKRFKEGEANFLDEILSLDEKRDLLERLSYNEFETALGSMRVITARKIMSALTSQAIKARRELYPLGAATHNVHIKVENATPDALRAVPNYRPENWNPATGKGKYARMVLAAWTAACREVADLVVKMDPELSGLKMRTGWVFSEPTENYVGSSSRRSRTEAMYACQADGTHLLLLNPVDDAGNLAYRPRSHEAKASILTLAVHEVAHLWAEGNRHNQSFAYAMTEICKHAMIHQSKIIKEMDRAMNAVTDEYKLAADLRKSATQERTSHFSP